MGVTEIQRVVDLKKENKTDEEIAKILNKKVGDVRHQLERIKKTRVKNPVIVRSSPYENVIWCWASQKWKVSLRSTFIVRVDDEKIAALVSDIFTFEINKIDPDVEIPYNLKKAPDSSDKETKKWRKKFKERIKAVVAKVKKTNQRMARKKQHVVKKEGGATPKKKKKKIPSPKLKGPKVKLEYDASVKKRKNSMKKKIKKKKKKKKKKKMGEKKKKKKKS